MTGTMRDDTAPSRYPAYAAELDDLRAREFPYLDRTGHVYLDYAGAGLAPIGQVRAHHARLSDACFGNPHSASPASMAATQLVESARCAVLDYFGADPDEYAVIFTPNASGACRLVGEAYPFEGRRLVLAADNHNSVLGVREFARRAGAEVRYVPVAPGDLRIPTDVAEKLLTDGAPATGPGSRGLFAYPAQSNFSGVQHPLEWIELGQRLGYDVLLDAAAYVSTNRLDLSAVHPDFVAVSWYKVFGYPTGVGSLIARRAALARLGRPWFAGGTVLAASALGHWHEMAPSAAAFEDGTLNFLSIPDIGTGIAWLSQVGIERVHQRLEILTTWLLDGLRALRHANSQPLIRIYGPSDAAARGATVAFNVLDPEGRVVDERLVARDSAARNISLRTGCFCNPGAGESAFGLETGVPPALDPAVHTVDDYLNVLGMESGGAVRVSLGVASTLSDVNRLLAFVQERYTDLRPAPDPLPPRVHC